MFLQVSCYDGHPRDVKEGGAGGAVFSKAHFFLDPKNPLGKKHMNMDDLEVPRFQETRYDMISFLYISDSQ